MCRICFGEGASEEFIAPCACRGSMQFVHADCLREWINRTQNSESRRTCEQCGATYKVHRGVWANRRRDARLVLCVVAFFALALFTATALPFYSQCVSGGGWFTWRKRTLSFLNPDLVDRVEQLKWRVGEDGACRRVGEWHLDAALLYGSVKVCGIGLNVFLSSTLLNWVGEGEMAPPVLFLEPLLMQVGIDAFDYFQIINGAVGLAWWWWVSPWVWGYMPTESDSLVVWFLFELLGLACVLLALKKTLEDLEMAILERRGGLKATDLLIYDRIRGTYH